MQFACSPKMMSLPTWGRGLKHGHWDAGHCSAVVAPYMGAWIETHLKYKLEIRKKVAPYMGAWIETEENRAALKTIFVAPYMGAWIETVRNGKTSKRR